MLAKKYRIRGNQIDYILDKGETHYSDLFIIKSKPSEEKFSRYGVIISAKLEKSAVKRNRLKRQIYEILRALSKENSKNNLDIVLIPKKRILTSTFEEIEKDLYEQFK